jgi:hypothetical protein
LGAFSLCSALHRSEAAHTPGRGGRSRVRLRPAPLAVALALVLAAPAGAQVPFKDVASSGPLTHVYVGNELSCQVAYAGDNALELYPSSATPGDCGTLLAVGGILYAPNFAGHARSSASSLGASTPFTPVSQSEVSGAGTTSSPFRVVTVADAGATGLRLSQTDSYVVGQESYRTDVTITNSGPAAQSVILYRAGDCYLQESDSGFGFVQGDNQAPGCAINANNTPPARIEQWVPITAGANYMEAGYSDVWRHIGTRTPFPNTCLCTDRVDNGAGVSWSLSVAPGAQTTVAHYTTFSPRGVAGPPPAVSPAPERCGTTRGPRVCLEGPDDLRRLGCLRRGGFVHRFRVKLKKRRGGLLVNRSSRVRIVYFALDRGANGTDRKRPYYALVDGQSLRPGRHVLRADVRLRVPRTGQRFRKRLAFSFRTCG